MSESIHTESNLLIVLSALYLVNLMLLPGIAFIGLLYMYFKHANKASSCLKSHLNFVLRYSVGAGVCLLVFPSLVLLLHYESPYTWMFVLTFWVCLHAGFILLGMLNLSRALNHQGAFKLKAFS